MASSYYDRLNELRATWNPRDREQITPSERLLDWSSKWLQSRGYMLRPRYSQIGCHHGEEQTNHPMLVRTGGQNTFVLAYINYLTSLTLCLALPFDGCYPCCRWNHCRIERIFKSEHPYESVIHQFLTSDALAASQITIAYTNEHWRFRTMKTCCYWSCHFSVPV